MTDEIYTDIGPAEGERARRGARVIIASGGDFVQNRRYFGYHARGSVMKLYPADAYTYKLTSAPFIISVELIRRRKKAMTCRSKTNTNAEKRRIRREAIQKMESDQYHLI